MIPSVLATQFREGLTDYVETTFPVTSPIFEDSIRSFLEKKDAFFHEPFISVKMPFRVASHGNDRFEAIHSDYAPYVHQNKAFDRLNGNDPRSTLVATGTGSGKTECFLYPVLEYCYQHRGERGIKALIIYPMNALATDQALRMAKQIYASPELKDNVRVGMYVGGKSEHDSKTMGPDRVITDRATLIENPPDILLTNYKMLDYLLVRPRDSALWSQNTDPETLRYIVVDEMHTFDGAQGTDLACLIRRLKNRLKIMPGYLCCVGTSATMGGPESVSAMLKYAQEVFGEPFEDEAIITEDRLTSHEFLNGQEVQYYRLPTSEEAERLTILAKQEREQEYITGAVNAWFDEADRIVDPFSNEGRVELAQKLMQHSFFQSLMGIMDGNIMQPFAISDEMSNVYPEMATTASGSLLDSMFAMISHARILDVRGNLRPFLHVMVQLWMRELRRVLGRVDREHADLLLESDLNHARAERKEHYLPVVNCRDCGATGWAGLQDERGQIVVKDIKVFYNKYFAYDKHIRMVFPRRQNEGNSQMHQRYQFCPQCLYVQMEQTREGKCAACGHETIPVWMPDIEVNKQSKSYVCPFCGGTHSLILVGLRSATAISAGISQLYGSHFNDDKKLLAFNDNVQDASHRAGFFNARTWRFGLRTAISQFINHGGDGMTMDVFGDALNDYWLGRMDDAQYVDTFIPFNMAGDRAYEELVKTGEFPDDSARNGLMNDLCKRIGYETFLEFGLSSQIGRTLEKSGAAMITPDIEKVKEIARTALLRIENEAGIQGLDLNVLTGWLLMWLNHMRQNGAFALPVYNAYVSAGAKGYLLSGKHISWMPGGYLNPHFPSVLSMGGASKNFEILTDRSWYARKLEALLGKTQTECPGIPVAVGIVLDELEKHHIINRMEGPKGLPVFGLSPRAFSVTRDVGMVRCDVCGHAIHAKKDHVDLWNGQPCSRVNCPGHYRPAAQGSAYFANLYENGDLVRIHAREHTGLLERDDREALEVQFKHKKSEHKVWDPNLLSCTPTLEMGIDIGDLSTVVLCSVPPGQAQYVQRIGRAGRTDGNAMTIAVAGSRPHDLYFFQDPMEMISGQVDAPGVFLNASAVLERQFVAFCMDNWIKSGITEMAIPRQVKGVLSKIGLKQEPVDAFPFNFLAYIKSNLSRLSRMFEQMFESSELSEESRQRIRTFAKGDATQESLRSRILTTFKEVYDQRESLRKDIKKLKKAYDDLGEKPKDASFDEKRKELFLERRGLSEVVREIEDKDTFNFLSDEGLLPNYAFPEAGIVLKAILTRKVRTQDAGSDEERKYGYTRVSHEYSRGAASAISEFAPDNSFYASGHKLTIDQIDVNTVKPEDWRLCPNCNHAAPVSSLHGVAACPYCGELTWTDQGQVRKMLKVHTVYSSDNYDDSRAGDESDERTSKFYSREMLVDIDEAHDVISGYQTTAGDLPFGYEFISKATLREINFGESDNVGTRLTVAGRDEVRNGFRICKYCGKIQPRSQKAEPKHTPICRAKAQGFKEPFEECMFLYREFVSEAIRILIPSTSMDTSSKKLESFAAAIMLGLRKKFNNVDHLRFTVMDAPIPGSDYRKQYMVIYDSVPGGTGYLKQLMSSPEALMEIFELSLSAMETCSCAGDQDKDGCYHCLYAYRQSTKINNISRRTAVEMLRKILSGKDSLKKIEGSISGIAVNTLFDSEFEKRFIEAISQSSSALHKVEITKVPVNGKEGYFLEIGTCCWEVELQVPFDGERGVSIPSKPDFVFWPRTAGNKQRPVVVFTDGFLYHKDKVAEDTVKRLAIREACHFPVWSLTWRDVQDRLDGKDKGSLHDTLSMARMPMAKYAKDALKRQGQTEWKLQTLSSFDLLIKYLADPDADETFAAQAQAIGIAMIDQKAVGNDQAFADWRTAYSAINALNPTLPVPTFKQVLFGSFNPCDSLGIHVSLPASAAKPMKDAQGHPTIQFDVMKAAVLVRYDDRKEPKDSHFEDTWSQFLYSTNLLQFINTGFMVAESGLDEDLYAWCATNYMMALASPVQEEDDTAWAEILDQVLDEPVIRFVKKLREAHKAIPTTVGLELDGEVVAELVWEDEKIAVQTEEQKEYKGRLEEEGWRVFAIDDPSVLDTVKEA